jgi:hypothetical protein
MSSNRPLHGEMAFPESLESPDGCLFGEVPMSKVAIPVTLAACRLIRAPEFSFRRHREVSPMLGFMGSFPAET